VLACSAVPLSDLEVEYEPKSLPGGIRPREYQATVVAMRRAAPDVMIVRLALPGGEPLRFYAGQYINVLLPEGAKRSFSFATAPYENREIELQIRHIPGGKFTSHVFDAMQVGDPIRFEGPLGSFFLREDSDKPIIFVAGATGFAPVKSMIEHAFHTGMQRRMVLYWGTRRLDQMYARELCEQWARERPNFTFVPVLSDPQAQDRWSGRTGLVHEAILADFPTLRGHQVYACGSVAMVEAAHPAFVARGLTQDDCFSDAFRLVPHGPRRSAEADLVRLGGA
jgi:NAD(P)H-flavin reductase